MSLEITPPAETPNDVVGYHVPDGDSSKNHQYVHYMCLLNTGAHAVVFRLRADNEQLIRLNPSIFDARPTERYIPTLPRFTGASPEPTRAPSTRVLALVDILPASNVEK